MNSEMKKNITLAGKLSAKILLLLLVAGLISCSGNRNTGPVKPNIVFIFADDLNYDMIHALGNDEIITPNLDRLVEEGVTLTHAYNMGAWTPAVCISSRGMLNTGRSLWEAHKAVPRLAELAADGGLWAKMMEKAGYETYMTGKWHVKVAPEEVFDHVVHERPGMPNQTPEGYDRPKSPADTVWEPWHRKYGGYWKGGKHWSEVLGDDAVAFLQQAAKKEKPFFMYLAFNASHDPRQSPRRFVEMYDVDSIALPASFLPEYPYGEQIGSGRDLRDERLMPFPRTPYAVRVNRLEYNAITTHMDVQIGRILQALKETGKMDNTYIFFTADHGLSIGAHGLAGKQNLYDISIRVPFLVVGPDIPANKRIDADVYLQDVMATALELAGASPPDTLFFHSVMPLIRGERTRSYYPAVYGAYLNYQRMIRKDGFKLIVYPEVPVVRLYDLNKDPEEINDLAQDPACKGKVKELFKTLQKLQEEMEDTLELKKYFPELSGT
jgi:arylsulfatase A-like enzyme